MTKYAWTERAICDYYYEKSTGKVVASLSRLSMSDDIWHADVNGDRLGQYVSEKQGRQAIEYKVQEIEDDYTRIRETVPKKVFKDD